MYTYVFAVYNTWSYRPTICGVNPGRIPVSLFCGQTSTVKYHSSRDLAFTRYCNRQYCMGLVNAIHEGQGGLGGGRVVFCAISVQ